MKAEIRTLVDSTVAAASRRTARSPRRAAAVAVAVTSASLSADEAHAALASPTGAAVAPLDAPASILVPDVPLLGRHRDDPTGLRGVQRWHVRQRAWRWRRAQLPAMPTRYHAVASGGDDVLRERRAGHRTARRPPLEPLAPPPHGRAHAALDV